MSDAALKLMIEALKAQKGQAMMPFPDNRNPDMDFVNRWPDLPPSGILNDLKPPPETTPPLRRKLNMFGPNE